MLRVVAYTGGRFDPSSRFRVRQYLDRLPQEGVQVAEIPARCGRYPPRSSWLRPAWGFARLSEALLHAPGSRRYDLVLLQRELLSTFVTAESLYGHPRVLDVDDAIWVHRRGAFADRLAASCDAVICGNAYLAGHFGKYCKRIFVLPTAVDAKTFVPPTRRSDTSQVLGWSGTSGNLRELQRIEPALKVVMQRFPESRLRVVCNQRPALPGLPTNRVDYVCWSPAIEVSALQDLRAGLMPLRETAWTLGKCAFKMLTYMACGVPVVASPVGMNAEVLAMGNIGFGSRNIDEWVDALSVLLGDGNASAHMGNEGRQVVAHGFSLEVLAPKLATALKAVAG